MAAEAIEKEMSVIIVVVAVVVVLVLLTLKIVSELLTSDPGNTTRQWQRAEPSTWEPAISWLP